MRTLLAAFLIFGFLSSAMAQSGIPGAAQPMVPNSSGSGGGGGGSPGGSANSVQYNSSGSFGGVSLSAGQLLEGQSGAPIALTPGTGVLTALGVNIGSAGAPVLFNGDGGTPSSLTLTNATGLPIAGISGLGTGVATALAASLNGSGAISATTSPTFVTPALGVATATSLQIGSAGLLASTTSNVLSLQNSTSPQAFRVLGSFTDSSDKAWAGIAAEQTSGLESCVANTLCLGSYHTGTSTNMTKLRIDVDGTNQLDYGVTASSTWSTPASITATGGGANITAGHNLISSFSVIANNSSPNHNPGGLIFSSSGTFNSASDGVFYMANNAGTGFTRLDFGGTTSSFPALQVSSTVLKVRLADNSADAAMTAAGGTFSGALINTGIAADTGQTDATVCEDTTAHQFYSGTGTLGVCLGTSSARYKHDIEPIHVGLPQIMALRPKSYHLNADHGDSSKLYYGFTAEQGGRILPALMTRDNSGEPNTFDYLGLVPVLVSAIQEQQREIEKLQKK